MESAPVTTRRSRGTVLGALLAIIWLPVALAVTEAAAFHVRNRSNGTIVSSGEKREYLLYVPRRYDATRPAPLIISLHGAGLWGAGQQEISQWNRIADRDGFLVVYPSGAAGQGPRVWQVNDGPALTKDVRFISELIDTLRAAYDIDPARIYANGLSNGGGMAFVLSCTLSDRIAAVGMVAAAQTLPWTWCADRRAVPMIAFHGTDDAQVPYHGGRVWMFDIRWPDVSAWAANWAGRNQCAPHPADSAVATDVTRRQYTGCSGDAAVVLYTVQGGGHSWPGGKRLPEWWVGPTNTSVDATSLMWAFFREHPLRS
jgi:polyhydroxybutyrate depolymerase